MYSKRQNRVSRLLQKEISEIFQREGNSIIGKAMVTVTVVRVSPDLTYAKAYLSIFAADNKENVFARIEENTKNIRHFLSQRIRHQFKKTPELAFTIDDSLDHIEHIESLLKK